MYLLMKKVNRKILTEAAAGRRPTSGRAPCLHIIRRLAGFQPAWAGLFAQPAAVRPPRAAMPALPRSDYTAKKAYSYPTSALTAPRPKPRRRSWARVGLY